jgi:hypothetical protein
MNNTAKSEQLGQQADDLEEAIAKEFNDKSSHVVMFQQGSSLDSSREDMAVITVTQSLSNIGAIESANNIALSMFGYNKRDMIGKNIAIIIPFPMNTIHDDYIMRFISTGRSVRGVFVSALLCCA